MWCIYREMCSPGEALEEGHMEEERDRLCGGQGSELQRKSTEQLERTGARKRPQYNGC